MIHTISYNVPDFQFIFLSCLSESLPLDFILCFHSLLLLEIAVFFCNWISITASFGEITSLPRTSSNSNSHEVSGENIRSKNYHRFKSIEFYTRQKTQVGLSFQIKSQCELKYLHKSIKGLNLFGNSTSAWPLSKCKLAKYFSNYARQAWNFVSPNEPTSCFNIFRWTIAFDHRACCCW